MAAKPAEAHLAIPTVAQGIEMDDMKSHRDDDDLNRLGKVPVLKVRLRKVRIMRMGLTRKAKLWTYVHSWLQLYRRDYMGSFSIVCDTSCFHYGKAIANRHSQLLCACFCKVSNTLLVTLKQF